MSHLGDKLRELRGNRSLNEVGRGAGIVPIDISRYEQGKRVPTKETLKKLAAYFELPYRELRMLYLNDLYSDPEEYQIVKDWVLNQP